MRYFTLTKLLFYINMLSRLPLQNLKECKMVFFSWKSQYLTLNDLKPSDTTLRGHSMTALTPLSLFCRQKRDIKLKGMHSPVIMHGKRIINPQSDITKKYFLKSRAGAETVLVPFQNINSSANNKKIIEHAFHSCGKVVF